MYLTGLAWFGLVLTGFTTGLHTCANSPLQFGLVGSSTVVLTVLPYCTVQYSAIVVLHYYQEPSPPRLVSSELGRTIVLYVSL